MLIGNPKTYDDPSYQARVARLDLALLGMYPGWVGDDGSSPAEAVAATKMLNRAQDADVNDGRPVTQVTLADRGGILLVRDTPAGSSK